jgi:hypothetical protein
MAGTLTPPFTPPDPTDPPGTANAGNGYLEFQAFKNYVVSFLSVQFDPTTGQFTSAARFPATGFPALTGDATTTLGSGTVTVVGINGTVLSALINVPGILKINTGGIPVIAVAADFPTLNQNTTGSAGTAGNLTGTPSLPNGTQAVTQSAGDNSANLATTSYVNYVSAQGQFLGTATNDNASTGNIGEFVQSLVAFGAAVSLTTATSANVTSISLTAGDWDVEANINFSSSGATSTASQGGIGTTTATLPTDGSQVYSGILAATAIISTTCPVKRISIAATTTVYLVASATFSAGTVSAFGNLVARRRR